MALKPKKLPTLLLVTQSPIVRTFFQEVVDKIEEMALIITSSKHEALSFFDKTYISFIVIDEKTSNLDLIPFCSEIRTLKGLKHTPIVVITAHLKKSFIRKLIKAGATDFLREPLDEDEFHLRMEMAEGVMETESKMSTLRAHLGQNKPANASLEKRTVLDDRAPRIVEQALSEKSSLALLLLEIDQYSQVLKGRGENVAHTLTIDIENRLQKIMRPQDLLYNQQKGKFAIFLPKTSSAAATIIGENIQEYLNAEIFSAGNIRFTLTASIGIATLQSSGDESKSSATNLERLLKEANSCLIKAKEKKNTIISKEKGSP